MEHTRLEDDGMRSNVHNIKDPPPYFTVGMGLFSAYCMHCPFNAKPTTGVRGQRALFSCHLTIGRVPIQVPMPLSKLQAFTFDGLHENGGLWPRTPVVGLVST